MNEITLMCEIPDYRRGITQLANMLFCAGLVDPSGMKSEQLPEYISMMENVNLTANSVIELLHLKFNISIAEITNDLIECIEHLPQSDLREYICARQENRIH